MKRYEKIISDYEKTLIEDNADIHKAKCASFSEDIETLAKTGSCVGLLLECPECPMFNHYCFGRTSDEIVAFLNEEERKMKKYIKKRAVSIVIREVLYQVGRFVRKIVFKKL